MKKEFDYDEYTNRRRDILDNFDVFCDELEDRALSSFGKVDNGQQGIGDDFIANAATHRAIGEGSREFKEASIDVPPAVFDRVSDDSGDIGLSV